MPTPTTEKPPPGLNDAYWLGVWRAALKTLKDQGSWAPEQKPLLDEYVFALRGAKDARDGFGWLDALETYADAADDVPDIAWTVLRQIATGLPTQWDKHVKRAAALADQLALTPRGRKAAGLADEASEPEVVPFAGLDDLEPRRRARAS